MGVSVSITHMLMLIVAVIVAGAVAGYTIYYTNVMGSQMVNTARNMNVKMMSTVEITYATIDNSTNPAHYVVYVKNTGSLAIPYSEWKDIDIYIGPYKQASLYTYDPSGGVGSGTFNMKDADGDKSWEAGETAIFYVYPTANPSDVPTYEAKIFLWHGLGDDYLFPPPP